MWKPNCWGRGSSKVLTAGCQRNLHKVEILLADHNDGSLPQLHGVAVHEFLSEANEVLLVDVTEFWASSRTSLN
jgi:hypothetical protein